jgi:hypothetical protein
VAKAFAAAAHAAFTLVVDCPVRLAIGSDISRAIFIDDGTTVEFTESGQITVDNIFVPAFVIANSSNITLTNWNVQFDGSLPVNPTLQGYFDHGTLVPNKQPSGAFSEERVTPWLAANRGIRFDASQGHISALWTGSTPMCAIFFISGDSAHIAVTGMQVRVPTSAGGDRFVPVVFSLNPDFKSNQSVTAKTPITAAFVAVPHDLTFSGITFDGTYMGWVGTLQNAVLENIRSSRYGDLQDIKGGNVGGINRWFAPPHLIYFTHYAATEDAALSNKSIKIRDVTDEGVRIGKARDVAGEGLSGNALSLKIGCSDCSVDNYHSARPDGFLDCLTSDGLTISNVVATYDSAFLNNLYPGWRFPQPPYVDVTFENVSLTDTAGATSRPPISNIGQDSNKGIVMQNVSVYLNRWVGSGTAPSTAILGLNNDISIKYFIKTGSSAATFSQSGTVETTLQATPATIAVGEVTDLSWSSSDANNCSARDAWSGALATTGTRKLRITAPGSYSFTIECRNAGANANSTAFVSVKQ